MTRCAVSLGLGLALLAIPAHAQTRPAAAPSPGITRSSEEGRPFTRLYRPFDVGGGSQTWTILQDRRGVIYFGNNAGILEYDGATWRVIRVGNTAGSVRALAMDENGRIYVGASATFGYLEPDAQGTMHYVSLVDRLPKGTSFNDVWRTFATPAGVYFQTDGAIFRWFHDQMTVIEAASRFSRASEVDGRVYVPTPEAGLNLLEGTALRPLPGTESLENEPFPIVMRYDASRLLIGTRNRGLFLYDGHALEPFPTEIDDFLAPLDLYRGSPLPDGTFALTTTNGGMAIIDHQGRRVLVLNRSNGFPSDTVYFAAPDRDGGLWAGLDSGIARVEAPSPLSYFGPEDGLISFPNGGLRHDGRLYLGTQSGASFLVPASTATGSAHFAPLQGKLSTQCWSFTTVNDATGRRPPAFLMACTGGIFQITGTVSTPVEVSADLSFRPDWLLTSRADPTRVWAALFDGLASIRWVDGRWIDEGRVPGTNDQIRSLFENPDGSLWAGTAERGLLRVRFDAKPTAGVPRPTAHIERYGPAQGLAEGGVGVIDVGGEPLFSAGLEDPYVAHFDPSTNRFVRDPVFDHVVGMNPYAGGVMVGTPDGRLFMNLGRETAVFRREPGGRWAVDRGTLGRLGTTPIAGILPDEHGVLWLQFAEGRFVRFDTTRKLPATGSVPVLIRRVADGRDRTLFDGDGTAAGLKLPASLTGLRFQYALPSFVDESATMYQSRLDGLDTDWSDWTRTPEREYTNLGFGTYTFRVRARDIRSVVTGEATYALRILPPWYRTWWADFGYLLAFLFACYGGALLVRRRVLGQERQRSQFAEARLRAEAAEALARTEGEGKKNVELLSEMGREITSSLDFDTIFGKLYERVNELADADVFGVGLYHADRHEIEYRLAIEKGKRYAPYTRSTTDRDQLPVWCVEHRKPVFINDLSAEYSQYVGRYDEETRPLEDGSMSTHPQSIIYLPLIAKEQVLGIITIQSFEKHAYTTHHLNVMQSLASYTAIALDNAHAYRQLNEHEHEIRRLFEEAERARATAEEADAAKSAFLSTVSHELRTPLTSVLGFAKIIKKRLEDRIFPLVQSGDQKVQQTIRQVEDNLKVVVSEGERLTKLIDDVLDLAKIEAGKLEWHMETVTIGDVIDRATAATASLFEQRGLRLETDVSAGLPTVTADRDRLIQVVINLISNAVKFTDAGSVTCRARQRGSELVVSVTDTGVGIAPVDQPKVFERFKQVGDTLTDKPKGTGLGLPICKEIVEHHGGRVWVESEVGRGSTFSFSLPLTAEQAAAAGVAPAPLELAALIRQLREQVIVTTPRTAERQPRILVVDDDPNIRELLLQEFTEAGYRVDLATNGREAIGFIRRDRPDLVVLDVMMPEMNGFDVAAVLKNDPTTMDIPIVILSIVQDRERGYRLGVDRYLTKPIDTDLLFKEVGSLIEQKKSHKRVLVVDEDATTVRTLTDVLTTRGYSVTEARGDDLVARAVAVQPDIIMLNSVSSARSDAVQMLRFEKGMENVLFLVYQ
ncbi:MAG TPA: ATP-binding protein [Vicinamibacterales bacterium]|nr:ATP-binding protein [Vicinamibacterales bacterium]